MQAAKAAGAVVSFDLNFREKLWQISGGLETAQATLRRIVEYVDVLVGNEEDLQKGLGVPGPEVAAKSSSTQHVLRHDGPRSGSAPAGQGRGDDAPRGPRTNGTAGAPWPGSTERRIRRPTAELDVYDRVGGGDGFAFGLIGLAVMGENLALNVESRGYRVAVFNRTVDKVDAFMQGRAKGKKFVGCHSLEELVGNLKRRAR
jgi:2-dehydro-3-deoxygluconokinase